MKKILLVVMSLVVCIGLIGAAFAYFTDTQTSAANTFTSGTVKISLSGDVAAGFTSAGMAPGDSVTKYLYVTNNGTLPVWFAGYINNWAQSVGGFIDQFNLQVWQEPSTTYPGEYKLYDGPVTGLIGKANALINPSVAYPPLPGGYQAAFKFVITLPLATPDAYQGQTMWATLKFDAIQSDNFTFYNAATQLRTP
jgi:predicted ribosomally synthesized peptide with SipW-like signal peptide